MRSSNHGAAQESLDGVPGAQVDVTALAPQRPTPHLELLCYRASRHHPAPTRKANDVASTQLIFERSMGLNASHRHVGGARSMRDPDGHALLIVETIATTLCR